MELVSKYIIICFGLFLIYSGFLCFKPRKVRVIIGKAGSTFAINYGELIIRLLLGISFVITSKTNSYEQYFTIFGYF